MYQTPDTKNVDDCQMYQVADTKNVADY